MFSKSSEYALKALLYITQHSENEKRVGVKEVAKELDVPLHFLAKILQKLTKTDILSSQKGPNGGFYMTPVNLDSTLADIIRAIDGTEIFNSCVLGLKECSEERPCPLHHSYKSIRRQLIRGFEHVKLGEFQEKLNTGQFFLTND